ncbi:MAG TPA: metallophosphoesterase, partial [Burkholderiales bacterium]|nr:metallophosphoesterase [Burkholderiales bacterium]
MRFPRPVVVLLALLHIYIGLRLLLPFDAVIQLVGGALLAVCFWLLPKGFRIRDDRGAWGVMLPWLTMGFFSWLLVLTVFRDVSLLVSAFALSAQAHESWVRISAIGVMALTPA